MALKNKRPKILFVFPQWHFNIEDTLRGCAESCEVHTLHLQSADEAQQVGTIGISGIQMHSLDLWGIKKIVNSEFFFPKPDSLWQQLDISYDGVIFKNIYDATSLMGFLFCTLKGIPFTVSEQKIKSVPSNSSILTKVLYGFTTGYAKVILRLAKVKAYGSTTIATKQLRSYVNKTVRIPFAIDTKKYEQKKYRTSGSTIAILNISKFQERKDQLLLIRAVDSIQRANSKIKIKLVLVGGVSKGNSYLNKLREEAKKTSVKVEFIEKIPRSKIGQAYRESDIFILSSYDEPAAYSHLEAMAYGVPAISSDENGTADYIHDGVNGAIFKAKDELSLREAIENIALEGKSIAWNRIKKMGRAGRKIAEKEHNPKMIAQQIKQLL